MRFQLALVLAVMPAAAQNPLVRIVNTSHPSSSAFQVGDRFEVLVTDETADLITNLIGVNALNESEIRNVLAIVRDAFAKPETLAPGTNYPARSLKLLQHLADLTDNSTLQRQIAETREYLQTR